MFDWLYEGQLGVYLFLAVVAGIFAALFVRERRGRWLYPIIGLALLAVAYFFLDRMVETRREQIARKLQAMANAVRTRDANTIFQHVARDFRVGGMNREAFRGYVDSVMQSRLVDHLTVWDVSFPDDRGAVVLRAKPESTRLGNTPFYLVRAQFVQEGTEWRMQSFQVFNPAVNTETPLDLPGLR